MSKLDIEKLKAMQPALAMQASKEEYENLPEGLIHFLKDEILNFSLKEVKTRNNSEQSARVLNSWIEQGLVKVDENDKGKINRFVREESIWLNLADELRGFGVSLDKLKTIRQDLFIEHLPDFTPFRFTILWTIFGNNQFLVVFSDGTFSLMPERVYGFWLSKKILPSHLCVDFSKLLSEIFTKNSFDLNFYNNDVLENNHTVKILYFLKTGDFESFKLETFQRRYKINRKSKPINFKFKFVECCN